MTHISQTRATKQSSHPSHKITRSVKTPKSGRVSNYLIPKRKVIGRRNETVSALVAPQPAARDDKVMFKVLSCNFIGRLATSPCIVYRTPQISGARAALRGISGRHMQTVIIVIHLMVVLALVGTVLLQKSEGGALGQGGGGGFMTGRGQANALTRATGILAALFFATSITLTILANWSRAPSSLLQGGAPVSAPADPARPAGPPVSGSGANVLDDLGKATKSAPVPVAPAVPEAPKTQ